MSECFCFHTSPYQNGFYPESSIIPGHQQCSTPAMATQRRFKVLQKIKATERNSLHPAAPPHTPDLISGLMCASSKPEQQQSDLH